MHGISGSHIHSDEWRAYNHLSGISFHHKTVCHERNYVNPLTGAHTQKIERLWLEVKTEIESKKRSVPTEYLQAHLDEFSWRFHRRDNQSFIQFVIDIGTAFNN